MVKKIKKYLKFVVCCALIMSLVAPSYAALSASDGSAFVTKAEFDSALADFNARLTTFEAGINSKIDSQVTSYLDRNGIWNGAQQEIIPQYKLGMFFANIISDLENPEFPDPGKYDVFLTPINGDVTRIAYKNYANKLESDPFIGANETGYQYEIEDGSGRWGICWPAKQHTSRQKDLIASVSKSGLLFIDFASRNYSSCGTGSWLEPGSTWQEHTLTGYSEDDLEDTFWSGKRPNGTSAGGKGRVIGGMHASGPFLKIADSETRPSFRVGTFSNWYSTYYANGLVCDDLSVLDDGGATWNGLMWGYRLHHNLDETSIETAMGLQQMYQNDHIFTMLKFLKNDTTLCSTSTITDYEMSMGTSGGMPNQLNFRWFWSPDSHKAIRTTVQFFVSKGDKISISHDTFSNGWGATSIKLFQDHTVINNLTIPISAVVY